MRPSHHHHCCLDRARAADAWLLLASTSEALARRVTRGPVLRVDFRNVGRIQQPAGRDENAGPRPIRKPRPSRSRCPDEAAEFVLAVPPGPGKQLARGSVSLGGGAELSTARLGRSSGSRPCEHVATLHRERSISRFATADSAAWVETPGFVRAGRQRRDPGSLSPHCTAAVPRTPRRRLDLSTGRSRTRRPEAPGRGRAP